MVKHALFVAAILAGSPVCVLGNGRTMAAPSQVAGHPDTPPERLSDRQMHDQSQLQQYLGPPIGTSRLSRNPDAQKILGRSLAETASSVMTSDPRTPEPLTDNRCLTDSSMADYCSLAPFICVREEMVDRHEDPLDLVFPGAGDSAPPQNDPIFITAAAAAVQTPKRRDKASQHLRVQRPGLMAEQVEAAIPASIRKAMIHDPRKAADALVKDFSGKTPPAWYAQLPTEVKTYYATVTAPPMMPAGTGAGVTPSGRKLVDQWISSVDAYKSNVRAVSMAAASNSRDARAHSSIARSMSVEAARRKDSTMAREASTVSEMASAEAHAASSRSSVAHSASTALGQVAREIRAPPSGTTSLHSAAALSLCVLAFLCGCLVPRFVL